jgi:D-glycero-beta-D-manno-heptose 1-phosphate adenylyltransferase
MKTTTKLLKLTELSCRLETHRRSGKRIVFTNGCFDLLHAGHVRYLAEAKAQGEILVVGLNSDVSVKVIKGAGRPIVPQDQRAEVLGAFACVDYVVLFDEKDPLRLIRALKPDILVKGADWAEHEIIGADAVKADGGRVVRIPINIDISSSRIISKILAQYGSAFSEERD